MRTKYQWGKGFKLSTVLRTAGAADLKANPTLAAGDVTISKDGGAFASLGTLPAVTPAAGRRVEVTISDAEAQAKEIEIVFVDQTATKEWDDQTLILSAFDAREGRVQYPTSASLVDRSNVLAGVATKASKPSFYILQTSMTASGMYDFDPRLLIGSVLRNEERGIDFIILGGYWFNDTGDRTYSVFGVAKDLNLFGCTEGGLVTPYSAGWTGAADEAGQGNGWTFICTYTNRTGETSGDVLEIYIDPNMISEHQVSNMLDLRRIQLANDLGNALDIQATGGNNNGAYFRGYGTGHGMYLDGAFGNGTSRALYASAYGTSVEFKVGTGTGCIAFKVDGSNASAGIGMQILGGSGGKALDAAEIGVPATLGDGASLAANMLSLAGKTASAATYDRATDSQEAIRDRGDAAWVTGSSTALTAQETRDAMKLAPTAGAPSAGSVDAHLDTIEGDTTTDIPALIAALPTDADVNAQCDLAISDAALATAVNLASVKTDTGTTIPAAIAALPTDSDVQVAAAAAISAAEPIDANVTTIEGADATDTLATAAAVGAGAALAAYDPPTSAELVSEINSVQVDIAAVQADTDDLQSKIGTPIALDGSAATLAAMLTKMADDNGGADFDATTDSLEKISTVIGTTLKLTDTVDSTTVSIILQKLMAMADGRFAKNTPAANQITFYKRDNLTPLFVVEIATAGRSRILG